MKKLSIILLSFLMIFSLFAENKESVQTEESSTEELSKKETNAKTPKYTASNFFDKLDIVMQFDPTLYMSPESHANKSNVVNIFYPLTIGAIWPNDYMFAVQPTLSFFMMEHLWFDKYALPAEIENRTTTTLSFLLNIPAVYSLTFKNQSKFQASAGLGIFLRFGLLANGVKNSDPGYSGSAGSDVKLINQWFWENAHWLYLSFGTSWIYPITSTIKVGPVLNAYVPMGTLIDQHNIQGLMVSFGIKLCR